MKLAYFPEHPAHHTKLQSGDWLQTAGGDQLHKIYSMSHIKYPTLLEGSVRRLDPKRFLSLSLFKVPH